MYYRSILLLVTIFFTVSIVAIGQQQPQNPDFEEWEDVGIHPDTLEPVNWSSLKTSDGGDLINMAIPVGWFQSEDAHSGMYSVKLQSNEILSLVAPGVLTNGRVHAAVPPTDAYVYTVDTALEWHTNFTDLPDSLSIWSKYMPQGTDIAHIIAVLHTGEAKIFDSTMTNWVAVANVDIAGEVNDWTEFEVPFTYLSDITPEYLLFGIFIGDAVNATVGSILYLDDFEFIYHETGVPTYAKNDINVYFSNNQLIVDMHNTGMDEICKLEVVDLAGRVLISKPINPQEISTILTDIPAGIYIYSIKSETFKHAQKIVKK